MVTAGDEGADFPPDSAVGLERDHDDAVSLVLHKGDGVKRRDGDLVAVDKRRPDVDVLVALVGLRDSGPVRDLLVVVNGEDVEAVVVDSDLVVGVSGGDCDLEVGSEEVWDGGVEGVDGDVLEDEAGLRGLKDRPDDQDGEEN